MLPLAPRDIVVSVDRLSRVLYCVGMAHHFPTTLAQIGRMNVLAISGGRVLQNGETLVLPVGAGYSVEVDLDEGSDTYTVRRVFTRGAKRFVKGTLERVYCDEVGTVAYQASCFHNGEFPTETAGIR